MNEQEGFTPINTGLAGRIRQQADKEKARLKAIMPSAATAIVEAASKPVSQQLNEVPGDNKQQNTGLAKKNRIRIEEEKKRMKALMPSSKDIKEEAQPTGSKDEHEPKGFNWAPVTPQEIAFKYPQASAISDIKMFLNAALQQPEFAVPLIGKLGTDYLIKTDKMGQFYMCKHETSAREFNNPALNTDLDNDEDDINAKEQMTPAYRRAAFGNNTAPGTKDSAPILCYEDIDKEFGKLIDFDLENRKTIKEKALNEGTQKTIKPTELNNMLYAVQKELRESATPELEKFANTLSEEIALNIMGGSKSYNYNKYCDLVKSFTKLTEG